MSKLDHAWHNAPTHLILGDTIGWPFHTTFSWIQMNQSLVSYQWILFKIADIV